MKKVIEKINVMLHAKMAVLRHPRTAAVILAGGCGSRMGRGTPKQLLELRGTPILIHTLRAFDACRSINEIVIVARSEDIYATEALCQKYNIKKVRCVVAGGATRAESAANGFAAISEKTEYVAIHDAARCLVTPRQIRDVALAAYAYKAASAANPVTDSVKLVNRYGMIEKDLPREDLWAAATPQIFQCVYYAAALKEAAARHAKVTDDNALMELIGQRVKLVDTGCDNFKITYDTDLARAEAVLKKREEKHGK